MDLPFILIALVIVATAAGAVALEKDLHCELCASLCTAGALSRVEARFTGASRF